MLVRKEEKRGGGVERRKNGETRRHPLNLSPWGLFAKIKKEGKGG